MTTDGLIDDDGAGGRATVVISSPEELIASIPAMLGFPPAQGSVVVMCGQTADGGQGPVVRMDVDGLTEAGQGYPEDECLESRDGFPDGDPGCGADDGADGTTRPAVDPGPARGLAQFCAREGIGSVHLVVVHEGCVDDYYAGLRAEDVASAFEYWLGAAGTEVEAAYGVGEFAEGAPWVDLFGMVRGAQLDPDSTQIAAAHAYGGRVRAGSRDEIDRLYLARDTDACDVDPHPPGQGGVDGVRGVAGAVERHDDAGRRLEMGEEVDDDELAGIGRDLLVIGVRDEIYRGLALRPLGDDDGRRILWWAIARRRPGRERSVALLLLGAAAYFAGSGVHAWSALSAALGADNGNSLARLLLDSLHAGLSPERLRQVAAAA